MLSRGATVIAVEVDPYHRAVVAYGHGAVVSIAESFVAQVLMPISPRARFERRSDLQWLITLSATDGGHDALIDAARRKLGAHTVSDGDRSGFLDVCMGVAVGADLDGVSDEADLVRHADAALCVALTRRVHVEFAHPSMVRQISAEVDLTAWLTRSVERDFSVFYQPIVAMPDRRVVGYESLLRWHTESGVLAPDAFLAVAEGISLLAPIGRHAIGEAIRDLAADISRMTGDEGFVSLNLSCQQLSDDGLVAYIDGLIRDYRVDPARVWIEVREDQVIRLETSAARTVNALHDLGCTICVDDLGAGFSALRYVRDLPVDVLKVDRTLIDQLVHSHSDRAVVRAISEMAAATGLRMVAEGIESDDVLEVLTEFGFDYAQGFFFGRPEPLSTWTGR
ncbi:MULTISPECIES: EAL domain-containing protein [Gordonia]|uniref:EAL domain-containing protein n=1 Tax=Gordonia amicalis TaxID=89053 RepID=A0AAE4R587_9ACTN|nr:MULTISPECIES: EAL domain-containing protein [Gordonia]ATD69736.1 EAL domain-containing protein [Gordonia sp. 1D]MCZ0911787.1 EAL domain-containing protein [Gordonia amicalis]MCZ4579302.1 EAL domain-containing protein [Gordonia amicalis]MCZ4653176.1 EAL domain-containing protein [Gordonia amicalis]MDJ0454279.1 EAL domain-containing protein [Gordonia amicalis]